ncbi:TlpA family protein disulfide reductase [Xanthomarina sp. F2636L]|uniref:TlpA family protein disulfide reductase n=1 Tax=Xanthomarina sp. F2636L TaxID=2996018 RepID=UPI00225E6193|nr:redoxin domain-containing protein [Xanthomarina sp. F2636L]MCX7549517.1 redoxin domain-containing protein [Xanthomarina sp. F2636L]
MKLKYFLFGLITTILVMIVIIFIVFKYTQSKQEEALVKEMTSDVEELYLTLKPYSIEDNAYVFKNIIDGISENILEDNDLIFVNFWATWCQPCIAEMPSLEKLINLESFSNNKIKFVFASKESLEKIKSFNSNRKYNLPFYQFKEKEKSIFNHSAIPTTYIIDKSKNIFYVISGSQNWNSTLIINFLNSIKS